MDQDVADGFTLLNQEMTRLTARLDIVEREAASLRYEFAEQGPRTSGAVDAIRATLASMRATLDAIKAAL